MASSLTPSPAQPKNRRIYVVGGDTRSANWMQGKLVSDMKDAHVVLFTGGADVSPALYGDDPHPTTYPNPARDKYEVEMWAKARELNKPLVGICRGAQFLCVMAGGKLVQHQENHHHLHKIDTFDGQQLTVTSEHHQAMFPWKVDKKDIKGVADWDILGWTKKLSRFHLNGDGHEMLNDENLCELEMAYFRETNALGIQSHPEWVYDQQDRNPEYRKYIEYCQSLLTTQLVSAL